MYFVHMTSYDIKHLNTIFERPFKSFFNPEEG
jgi:hypothetical protein